MNKARTEKVAVVDDVKGRVDTTSTAVVTEYRGLTVAEISSLRRALRAANADYKVLKNTLVRRAVAGTPSESLTQFLEGPTAIAWVKGDISAVAKILKEFAKVTPRLVLKGGVLDGKALTAADLSSLADLPSREVLLSQFAGLLASPLAQLAALFKAVPQSLAYGLAALIESKGGAPAPAADVPSGATVTNDATGSEEPEAASESAGDANATPADEVATPEESTDDTAVPQATDEAPQAATDEVPAAATDEVPAAATDQAATEESPSTTDETLK